MLRFDVKKACLRKNEMRIHITHHAVLMKHLTRYRCLGGMAPCHIHSKLQLLYLSVQQSQCTIIVIQSTAGCAMMFSVRVQGTAHERP